MGMLGEGSIRKMRVEASEPVEYFLPIGEGEVSVNALVGKQVVLEYAGKISCIHCGRNTRKSFAQGYCYPCFRDLAQCDSCIVKPEKCHFYEGTCREPEWAEKFCMQDHYVYLANSSGLKVGITRGNQIPTRWIDQGAIQARPIARVSTRQQSGFLEVALKASLADKTNWRTMLRNLAEPLDMDAEAQRVLRDHQQDIENLQQQFGLQAITILEDAESVSFSYPVINYPEKVTSMNLEKQPRIAGRLMGIKGQYLMFDCGVINIRNFAGYSCRLESV